MHSPLAALFVCALLAGQGPPRALADLYRVRVWDANAGLHHPTARSLAQTPDGYLWIGTFDGVAQLDGVRVQVHRLEPQDDNAFVALHTDFGGQLWAGTTRDIVRRAGRAWQILGKELGWPGGTVRSIVSSRAASAVWFATERDVFRWDGARFQPLPRPPREAWDEGSVTLAVDVDECLWAQSASCLSQWDGHGAWRVMVWRESVDVRLHGLQAARRGGVWVGEGDRIHRLVPGPWSDDPWRDERLLPAFGCGESLCLLEDREGRLWVGMFLSGLCVFDPGGRLLVAEQTDHLPDSQVATLFEDREANIWIGTGGGGAVQLTQRSVTVHHSQPSDSLDRSISSVCEDAPGSMLLATAAALVRVVDGVETTVLPSGVLGQPARLQCVTRGLDGTLWLATRYHGVWREVAGRWQQVPHLGASAAAPSAMFHDSTGRVWVGSSDGYRVWQDPAVQVFTEREVAGLGEVRCFLEDQDHVLWVGTSRGMFTVPPGQTRAQAARVCGTDPVHCMLLDHAGQKWAAVGHRRLVQFDTAREAGRVFEGIAPDRPSSLLEDRAGNLWIGSSVGIRQVLRPDLESLAEGRTSDVRWTDLDKGDGLPSADAGTGNRPCSARAADGRLWFATTRGVVVVDPEREQDRSHAPNTIFEEVLADGVSHRIGSDSGPVEVPAGSQHMVVRFTAVEFDRPDHVRFEYRLDRGRWQGADGSRCVAFPDLRPADYHLEVRASLDGEWLSAPATVRIRVAAMVHQTLWFRIAILLAAMAAAALGVAWVARRRSRRIAVAAERERALARERAAVANQMRSMADTLHLVTDSIPAQIFYLSPAGAVRFCNRVFAGWNGSAPDALIGRSMAELVGERAWSAYAPLIERAGRGEIVHEEIDLPMAADTLRTFQVSLVPQRHDEARVDGLFGLVFDVSDRKRAEQERAELEGQLHQAHKMEAIGTLAGGIAHDFNNILTAIVGNAEVALLQLGAGQDPSQRMHEVVRASQRARDVVRQILTFSRKRAPQREVLALEQVVEEAMRLVRSSLPSTVAIRVAAAPCPPVLADATGIHQVLMNLCSNAAYAIGTSAEGRIEVTLEATQVDEPIARAHQCLQPGRYVRLSVADNGPGMEPATLKRIFDPFFTTKPKGEGTGMGLAVVHGIVHDHQGTILVDSAPGRGATFQIYLPVAAHATLGTPAPVGEPPRGAGEELLFVDDEALIVDVVGPALEGLGYRVTCCSQPEAAVRLFQAEPDRFALVITDLTMPRMTGLELAWELRQVRKDVAILLTSGGGGAMDAQSAVALGFCGFLSKPYRRPELAQLVADALRRKTVEIPRPQVQPA